LADVASDWLTHFVLLLKNDCMQCSILSLKIDEIYVAGAGNDTLTGNGGMDVFTAVLDTKSILINAKIIQAIAIDIACSGD
jgi:Ca2+-binding RTX toxin-like protein